MSYWSRLEQTARGSAWLICTFLFALCPVAASKAEPAASGRAVPVDAAIDRMRRALVRIHVVSTEYRDGREIKMQAVGSGAIISKDGYIITNHHVAGHAARLVCTLWNREEIDAVLVGTDPLTDISIIQLKPAQPREFVPAEFGDSSKIRVGEPVLAMGSPMALSQSVTLGIISNTEMIMPRLFGSYGHLRLDGEDVGTLVRWIGHDAAIYGGNSGGPLVNLKGQIIGINEIQFGLSGAIPGNLAHTIAQDLITRGKVKRSWLGLDVQPLFKHGGGQRGVLVSGVIADSPAARAGLQPGDRLVSLAGAPISVHYDEEMPDLMRRMTSLPLDQDVPITIVRADREIKTTLRPTERGELNPEQQELKQWGLTARDISYLTALEMKRTNQTGVLVTSVRPGGPSGEAKPSLESHDVLTEVNGSAVANLEALLVLTHQFTQGKTEPTPVIATFERGAQRFLTVVKVGTEEPRDPGLEVSKAWLPLETHVISRDIAQQLGQPELQGFYITQVYPRSTAEKAGLKPGDFITAVDGEKLTASGPEHEEELSTLIRQYDIGAKVELSVQRGANHLKVPVELARSPKLRREMKKYRNDDFEFTARDLSFFDAAEAEWPEGQRGALIEDVKPGGWAELGSLNTEDLLVAVDDQPITDVETLRAAMDKVARERKTFVVMKVMRGIHTAFLEMEPTWKQQP